jgi:hypothetical protein
MPATINPVFAAGGAINLPLSQTGGKVRSIVERFTLNTDVVGSYAIGVPLPAGAVVLYGVINTTVTLGSSTIAIGITGTTAKYRAAAVFTAINTPTLFGATAAVGVPLAAEEQLLLTVAEASLPASGTLVIEVFYTTNN